MIPFVLDEGDEEGAPAGRARRSRAHGEAIVFASAEPVSRRRSPPACRKGRRAAVMEEVRRQRERGVNLVRVGDAWRSDGGDLAF